nr:MAG TPA: hypothetical protein [Caudoviricetes sp.]
MNLLQLVLNVSTPAIYLLCIFNRYYTNDIKVSKLNITLSLIRCVRPSVSINL